MAETYFNLKNVLLKLVNEKALTHIIYVRANYLVHQCVACKVKKQLQGQEQLANKMKKDEHTYLIVI
jgi:hypothetical protein